MDENSTYAWQLSDFGIPQVWNRTKGEGVKIAILDSGIDRTHSNLVSANIDSTHNFLNNTDDVTDNVGHGTHCAGIIAGQGPKIFGVAPNSSLLIGKITDSAGGLNEDLILNGIKWACEKGASIISLSATLNSISDLFKETINQVVEQYNVLIISSLSNDGDLGFDMVFYPASLASTLSIGAVNQDKQMDSLTSRSSSIDVGAPGRDILSTWMNNEEKLESGSSMATAYTSGVCALILSKLKQDQKTHTVEEIRSLLKNNVASHTSFSSNTSFLIPVISPTLLFEKLSQS